MDGKSHRQADAHRSCKGAWILTTIEIRFERGDILLVHGPTAKVEAFAALATQQRATA